jgi:hypothetical protein
VYVINHRVKGKVYRYGTAEECEQRIEAIRSSTNYLVQRVHDREWVVVDEHSTIGAAHGGNEPTTDTSDA